MIDLQKSQKGVEYGRPLDEFLSWDIGRLLDNL